MNLFLLKHNISIPKKVINLYISYTINLQLRNLNTDFTLGNCLFGFVKLTKNADRSKHKYSGYGIGFDSRSEFPLPVGSMKKKMSLFLVSSSMHIDNKRKDILILGEGPTEGLHDTTSIAEAKYAINFTRSRKRFVLSLCYNGGNSFLFVNATKIYQFKAKCPEIKNYTMCLGNISKKFTINNMKKTGLEGSVQFSLLILILLILAIF